MSLLHDIRIISAVSRNGVIGRNGKLPWKIPEDTKWFESQIQGGILILGRKSFEETGKIIPGVFRTIVVTRSYKSFPGVHTVRTIQEALKLANKESSNKDQVVWMGGGTAVYDEALPLAQQLYLTQVHAWVDGDTRFPIYYRSFFPHKVSSRDSSDRNFDYTFSVLSKHPYKLKAGPRN